MIETVGLCLHYLVFVSWTEMKYWSENLLVHKGPLGRPGLSLLIYY